MGELGEVLPTRQVVPADLGVPGTGPMYLAGFMPPGPRLAIVGSRAALHSLRIHVPTLVEGARRRGFSVVSGGAMGVDADAHRAALDHSVPQLAVLPCGPDRVYPRHHAELFSRIATANDSGVLFPHAHGTDTVRAMFASRNAIVVAVSAAVVVVQSHLRSGSIGTGIMALKKRCAVAIVPGSPGNDLLAQRGAIVLDARDMNRAVIDWLDDVLGGTLRVPVLPVWPQPLQWLASVFELHGAAGVCVDDGPGGSDMALALIRAEGLGLVRQVTPGRYYIAH